MMNGRSILALASLAVALPLRPAAAATAPTAPAADDNPFTSVITRNIFDLKPIPQHNPADDVPTTPPPKITPNGIMTIFGKLQVLFKVQATTPGQPPKEISYTMGEGERQDDIEVKKIDEAAATITFNNHGQVETLELSKTAAGSNPVPGAPGAPGAMPHALPLPAVAGNAGAPAANIGFGGRFGRNRANSTALNPNPASGVNPQQGATGYGVAGVAEAQPAAQTTGNLPGGIDPSVAAMSPEARVLMIEAQRAKWLQEGNPAAAIMPGTPITPQVTGEGDASSAGGQ